MSRDVLLNGKVSEVEILEFKAGANSYGVNVSDIKEILPYNNKYKAIPNSHPHIEGIIMPRDFLITIVNFKDCLKLADIDENKNEMLIVTSINDLNIAFHVDSVSGIHRLTTDNITEPGKKISTTEKSYVIGIFAKEDKKIEIVDLRAIIRNINPNVMVD